MLIFDLNVNAQELKFVNVNTTQLAVDNFGYNFELDQLYFDLRFGDDDAGAFVPVTGANLRVLGGPVFSGFVALDAVPMSTGIPENIRQLMETLNASPGLIDGVNVILQWLPLDET